MVVSDTIDVSDIPAPYHPDPSGGHFPSETEIFMIDDLKGAKKAFETAFIKRKLVEHEHNIRETAKAIGVGRSYLYKKLKKEA